MRYLDAYAQLISVRSEQQWILELERLAKNIGFTRILYVVVPNPESGIGQGLVQSTYPECWRKTYDERGMANYDPTVSHCRSKSTPLLWAPDMFSTKQQKELYEEASAYGLRAGVSLPIHGRNGIAGMFSLALDQTATPQTMKDIAHCLPELVLLRDVAYEKCLPYFNKRVHQNLPALTDRELECLRWLVAGKSSWDIGQILKISEATVNFHIANVRAKLGASSRRVAAVKATQLGLVKLN